ncbi:MAG: tetratricopeptide repeat protein [Acidobacteriota bacterium]
MRRVTSLILVCLCLALAAGCAKKAPPMEPSAQEFFDSGMRAFNQENYSMALSDFEMAVAKSPSFVEANYYVGLSAWKLNMIDKSKRAFIATLNLNPNHIQARESLGILSYNISDFTEAKRHLEAARNLNSINPQVYYCLGRIYVMEGRCPEALEVFQRGLAVDSTYLPLKTEFDNARRTCGKGGGTKAPPVIYEKKFRGGGKAIDPSDF